MLAECERQSVPVMVTEGFRSFAKQQELYEQGRSKAGLIVTNAKAGYSFHNYGIAFDVAFKKGNTISWDGDWDLVGKIGKSFGLEWGGDWVSFKDRPHFQFTKGKSIDWYYNQATKGEIEESGKDTRDIEENLVKYNQSNGALNINKNMLKELFNDSRLKSLLWRAGMMALAFLVTAISNNLTALELSPQMAVFVGLVLGEISKAVNNHLSSK